jgi:hypothetical protein
MSIPPGVSLDELNIELEAMQTIARALAGVRDPETRLRILRWTSERFGVPVAAAPNASAAVEQRASDPSLSVDGVDLFDDDRIIEMAVHEPAAPAAPATALATHVADQPLDSLVRGFGTEIRALALQWHGA